MTPPADFPSIPSTPEVADFMKNIAAHIVLIFEISLEEAQGRINRFWSGLSFLEDNDMILHKSPEYWAKTIYYGSDVLWWLGEEGLSPQPYP